MTATTPQKAPSPNPVPVSVNGFRVCHGRRIDNSAIYSQEGVLRRRDHSPDDGSHRAPSEEYRRHQVRLLRPGRLPLLRSVPRDGGFRAPGLHPPSRLLHLRTFVLST